MVKIKVRSVGNAIAWFIVSGLSAGLIYYSASVLNTHEKNISIGVNPPPLSRVKSELLNVITLGHKGLYDDFAHLWMLQVMVDSERIKENKEETRKAIQLVASHNPKIETFYVLACFVLAKEIEKPEDCEKVSLAGLRHFPISWWISMTQAFIFYQHLDQPAKAAAYYSLASRNEKAPKHIPRIARKLLKKKKLSAEEREQLLESTKIFENFSDFKKLVETTQSNEVQ